MQLQYLWHVVRLMTTVELKIPAIHFILLWPVLYSWGWFPAAACTWVRWCAEFWWTSCWRDSSSGLTPPSPWTIFVYCQLVIFPTKSVIIFSEGEGEKLFDKGAFETKFVSGTVRNTKLSYTMKNWFSLTIYSTVYSNKRMWVNIFPVSFIINNNCIIKKFQLGRHRHFTFACTQSNVRNTIPSQGEFG